jgi:hypothetical protein
MILLPQIQLLLQHQGIQLPMYLMEVCTKVVAILDWYVIMEMMAIDMGQ